MRIAIGILVLVAIAVALLFTFSDRTASRVAMVNGMKVEFIGTSVGGAPFSTEKRWHKIARRWLPARWRGWLPPVSSGSCSSGTNSITVFFQVTDPTGAQLSQNPWQDYSASDESGFVYERHGGYCSYGGSSNSMMFGLTLRAFPRRGSSFLFRLHGVNQSILATFRVPNPVRGPFPEWTPEPLPQTQTNGPVTLTLEAMRARGGPPPRYIVPRWKIESPDPAWARARARSATLVDATGNEAQMLSPRENAWRLRTWVHRDKDEDFGAADRFSITNLAVPQAGEFHSLDQSAVRHGIELKVHVIAGPGELVVSNGVRSMSPQSSGRSGHSTSQSGTSFIERWPSQTHFLLLEAIGVAANDEVRIRLFDPDGQNIKLSDSGYQGTRSGGRLYQRQFTPGQNAHSLALEIIVSRPVFFEFTVDPNDMQTFNP